jgi:hypothetical protein
VKASPSAHPDFIADFSHAQQDKIDLRAFRAAGPGGKPPVFIGAQTFAHYRALYPDVLGTLRHAGGELPVTVNGGHPIPCEIVVHGAVQASDVIL